MFFRKRKKPDAAANTPSQRREQALRMFEKFMNLPPSEREQAVIEARNILENFRIVRAQADKGRKRTAQDDASSEGGGGDAEASDEHFYNALEEAVLFHELLLLHPELLGKMLDENNKKLRLIMADVLRRGEARANAPDHPPLQEQQLQRMAQELEKQMQQMRLKAAREVKEARARRSGKDGSPAGGKGLDAILSQLVKPALEHHEKTIAISRILQAPKEAMPLAEKANQEADALRDAPLPSREKEQAAERG